MQRSYRMQSSVSMHGIHVCWEQARGDKAYCYCCLSAAAHACLHRAQAIQRITGDIFNTGDRLFREKEVLTRPFPFMACQQHILHSLLTMCPRHQLCRTHASDNFVVIQLQGSGELAAVEPTSSF